MKNDFLTMSVVDEAFRSFQRAYVDFKIRERTRVFISQSDVFAPAPSYSPSFVGYLLPLLELEVTLILLHISLFTVFILSIRFGISSKLELTQFPRLDRFPLCLSWAM